MAKKLKKKRKGFTRSKKEWEETISRHIGTFIDKLTTTDIMNIGVFASSAYLSYSALKELEKTNIPLWLTALQLTSPANFVWEGLLLLSASGARMMTEEQKIATSLLAGYAALKLPSVVVQTAPSVAALVK